MGAGRIWSLHCRVLRIEEKTCQDPGTQIASKYPHTNKEAQNIKRSHFPPFFTGWMMLSSRNLLRLILTNAIVRGSFFVKAVTRGKHFDNRALLSPSGDLGIGLV